MTVENKIVSIINMTHVDDYVGVFSDGFKSFDVKIWLNKKLKPDKESENRDDIVFWIEIIHNILQLIKIPW